MDDLPTLLYGYVRVNSGRHPVRDCRGPEAMDGAGLSHPCDLDSGNPCRNDGVDLLSTTNADIVFFMGWGIEVFNSMASISE
ncbi:MAG: hypothetical protein KGZ88_17875 [Methylomicrobium sp.]|nr:hypothetical protein [Methylomicrobium sp.]